MWEDLLLSDSEDENDSENKPIEAFVNKSSNSDKFDTKVDLLQSNTVVVSNKSNYCLKPIEPHLPLIVSSDIVVVAKTNINNCKNDSIITSQSVADSQRFEFTKYVF